MSKIETISADWPVPKSVKTAITTRKGGISEGAYRMSNLADHVGDNAATVDQNRTSLKEDLGLSVEPFWLNQTHSSVVLEAGKAGSNDGDASFTSEKDTPLVVLTADCLPILVCNYQGDWVMAIHAGWQGIGNRIIEEAISAYPGDNKADLMAWLGPAIGPNHFEVQDDVIEAVTADLSAMQKKIFIKKCFTEIAGRPGYYLCDLFELGRQRLNKAGVFNIFTDNTCTFSNPDQFYSYRRDGGTTGRFASLIWLV